MLDSIVGMKAFAYYRALAVDDYCSNVRVRRRQAEALLRKRQCASEKNEVGLVW